MCGERFMRVFLCLLAFLVLFLPLKAVAQEPAPAYTKQLFLSGDLWSGGWFTSAALCWSPSGLDKSGFQVRLKAGTGFYQYDTFNQRVKGASEQYSALGGYKWVGSGSEFTMVAGLDVQHHVIDRIDRGNTLLGLHTGAKLEFSYWGKLSPTMMLALDGSVSSLGGILWGRAATGWWSFDKVWLGPEVSITRTPNYTQVKVGVHLTGLDLGKGFSLHGAGGLRHDGVAGYYAGLNVEKKF
jgi:hypothetical protein